MKLSIATEFIVPIKIIKEKYPGGWDQCLEDHENLIGGRVWYDDYLFHDGAMSPMAIESLVGYWESLGFKTHLEDDNGNPIEWIDVCVHESMFGGATLKCDWLELDEETGGVYLKGTEPGKLVSRINMPKYERDL